MKKSQKVTVGIFREIKNSEKKVTFSREFECLGMSDTSCQTTNGRMVQQTPGIGQVSPGLVWNARAAPEHLQSCSLAYGLHPKRFLLIFDLSDSCQTIFENEVRSQKTLSVTLSDMMV